MHVLVSSLYILCFSLLINSDFLACRESSVGNVAFDCERDRNLGTAMCFKNMNNGFL